MRVLIIGYGSAGQRHARVLSSKFKVESIYIKTKQNNILNNYKME